MDCHSLLQGIFLTQGSNPSLLHSRWILYHLSHQGSPQSINLLIVIIQGGNSVKVSSPFVAPTCLDYFLVTSSSLLKENTLYEVRPPPPCYLWSPHLARIFTQAGGCWVQVAAGEEWLPLPEFSAAFCTPRVILFKGHLRADFPGLFFRCSMVHWHLPSIWRIHGLRSPKGWPCLKHCIFTRGHLGLQLLQHVGSWPAPEASGGWVGLNHLGNPSTCDRG